MTTVIVQAFRVSGLKFLQYRVVGARQMRISNLRDGQLVELEVYL
jgi:hypothetical protein